jgi:coatomer protein complex subunit gamma
MYLVIKELSDIAEDVIMVTQSLMKDIQAKQETSYRANAIRALCQITDVCHPIISIILTFKILI